MALETPNICHVCGQVCLTEYSSFGLPIKDISTGRPITGACCSVCDPKIEAYCASDCQDFNLLPDGPLKERLYHIRQLYMGVRCLDVVVWLAEHHGKVDFHSSQPEGAEADQVAVTATLNGTPQTLTGDTLEAVVTGLQAGEGSTVN